MSFLVIEARLILVYFSISVLLPKHTDPFFFFFFFLSFPSGAGIELGPREENDLLIVT